MSVRKRGGWAREVGAATSGGFSGKQVGSKMADEPGDLKGEELEVEKREKTGEEQGRGEAGKREKEEGGGGKKEGGGRTRGK